MGTIHFTGNSLPCGKDGRLIEQESKEEGNRGEQSARNLAALLLLCFVCGPSRYCRT